MKTMLLLTAIGAAAFALPASASPLAPASGVESRGLIQTVQLAERADRSMRRGLKTMQRNSDRRARPGDGTVRHPSYPAANARTNQDTGGPRAVRR
jgi:hypothetical protein